MNSDAIHVLLGTDDNYVPGAVVTMVSILKSSSPTTSFTFHLMDTGIAPKRVVEMKRFFSRYPNCLLDVQPVDVSRFGLLGARNFEGVGFSAYARILAADVVPADKCIYVDTDILVTKDFDELWRVDISDYAFAACLNTSKGGLRGCDRLSYDCPFVLNEKEINQPYYNSGFMVCNLAFWRASNFCHEAFKIIQSHGPQLKSHDQTIINYLFRGKGLILSPEWNATPWWTRSIIPATNLHFTSKFKPWNYRFFLPAERMWYALYDKEVKPHWDVVRGTRKKIRGLFMFLRWYGIPALVPRIYCGLRKRFRNDDEIRQQNDLIQFLAMNRMLWHGVHPRTRRTISAYISSLN